MIYNNLDECIKNVYKLIVDKTIESVSKNNGGPFGASVVQIVDDKYKVISIGSNEVLLHNDPTAHAEMVAIREACKILKKKELEDCILISTSESCPMCLSAAIWAKIKTIYYVETYDKISIYGFKDEDIKEYILGNNKIIKEIKVNNSDCDKLLNVWDKKEDKEVY